MDHFGSNLRIDWDLTRIKRILTKQGLKGIRACLGTLMLFPSLNHIKSANTDPRPAMQAAVRCSLRRAADEKIEG
jgi:hypothetical protein